MKHQQVTVDMTNMVFTACSYLALAGAVWIFLRLIQACFWLPKHLKRQNDVQRMLQDKVDSYEKYVLECEEKEKAEMLDQIDDEKKSLEMSEKWKERRECLDMLKKELQRVREGKDMSDWDALLDEELKKHELDSKFLDEEEEEEENSKKDIKEKSEEKSEKEGKKIDPKKEK
ncbi:resistance to inhibitors of cholinesterase protein 3 isoform X1 [Camponotus floridanus]|uniref:resistance to inhibitors of cholinesterase protein 3 isoform X1 n=2 Tax=Camponotus floridanus TaxID=104421 RepID=UPI00059E8370|nr:resistance to inhibitors of cholinesterase protein 3 isoform X1 [Camponotus floridanus]XP_025265948.1 resistance to inhibitors of cholinesterase protein 3 isoform X1 [Camponotus floridanus]